jgi:membrane protease YdiL (CAAX protease family)
MQAASRGKVARLKSFGKRGDLFIVVAAVGLIPYLSVMSAKLFEPLRASIDPSGAFFFASVHHVFQLFFTLVLMKSFAGMRRADWGFNLHDWRRSLRITAWFSLIYLGPVFLVNVLPTLLAHEVPAFSYPLTARNMAGVYNMQFILAGTCEEPLFRGFVITVLSQSWTGRFRVGRGSISSAALWATFLFMMAHAQISIVPFSFHVSLPQQIWALGLGLYYAVVFEKTKSLLAPILSHGYSDGVIFLVLFTWALLAR